MDLPQRLDRILARAREGGPPSPEDCIYLLSLPERSLEADALKATADAVSRERFGNEAIILGQIGIDAGPCPGNCRFCVFGEGHTAFEESRLPVPEIRRRAREMAAGGDLYALFLMTRHEFNPDDLCSIIAAVRDEIGDGSQIVVNIGDFDRHTARALRDAGTSGAYHVCRLREGTDTDLDPERRRATFRVIRETGLDFYYCCEPIGPEHRPEELVDQLFLGIEHGCFQHAAMRRVSVPGVPLSANGQITERRLAQVVAVVALATLGCPETQNIAVHEPNLLGLVAGANAVYAESGANPRDTDRETERSRGLSVAGARRMLYEAGFAALRRGDGSTVPLDLAYLQL